MVSRPAIASCLTPSPVDMSRSKTAEDRDKTRIIVSIPHFFNALLSSKTSRVQQSPRQLSRRVDRAPTMPRRMADAVPHPMSVVAVAV